MSNQSRPVTMYAALGFVTLACLLLVRFAVSLPIHSDEINWAAINYRSIEDGGRLTTLFPQCWQGRDLPALPWIWYVPAWINHFIFQLIDHPLLLRLLGLAKCFGWQALWLLIIRRVYVLDSRQTMIAAAAMFIFFSFDVTFLFLVFARPEQTILLELSIIIAFAVFAEHCSSSRWKSITALAGFTLAVMYLGMTSPRNVVFIPVVTLAAYYFSRDALRLPLARGAFVLMVAAIGLGSYAVWANKLYCWDDAITKALFSYRLFPFHMLREDPLGLLGFMLVRLSKSFIYDFSPTITPLWLAEPENKSALSVVSLFSVVAYLTRMLLLFWVIRAALKNSFLWVCKKQCTINAYALLAIMLTAGLLALMTFQGTAYFFYTAALNVPLLLFSTVLFSSGVGGRWMANTEKYFFPLASFAGISLTALLLSYYPADRLEVINPNRIASFSMANFTEKQSSVGKLASQCDINVKSRHPVIDDITYLAFKDSYQPFNLYYVTNSVADIGKDKITFDIKEFMRFLDRQQSSGIIADCRNFLDPMLPYASREAGFCCISATTIKKLAETQGK